MRKIILIITALLLAGVTFAQEKSESVDNVLNELDSFLNSEPEETVTDEAVESFEHAEEDMPQAEAELPVAVEVEIPAEPAKPSTQTVTEAIPVMNDSELSENATPAPEPIPMEAVEEVVEESRDLYANGEFNRAKTGFEAVIKVAPEHAVAHMYLRKILERDYKTAELKGIDAVDAAWDNDMVLRSYDLSSEAGEKLELGDENAPIDLVSKFPEVSFPQGSSVVYQPRLEKLFVRNTRENLLIMEEVLDAMDVAKISTDVEQVEIEAKFIEVSEGTLEELGFEWRSLVGESYGIADDVFMPAGQYLFNSALRGGPSSNLPFDVPAALGSGSSAASGDWSTFRFEDTFNNAADTLALNIRNSGTDMDIIISALDQSSGADVLSAPRVVTKSGEEAIIRVGEKHLYPEVYEPTASGGNIVHVVYDDWEERLLGVELTVRPQVDGSQIEMELNPVITELLGWQTYEVAPKNSAYTWYQYRIGAIYGHEALEAKLPIFRKREIQTEVTIADGATIGMGGLINEKTESFEDKIPVLGSIPFIGRLFRNEGERSVKRNLLMFVTASKVEPTGRVNSAYSFE